ncbi:hypothetical protein [Thermococcus sp.]|uniref:hypothetical protein n=1 Tax=Thermococcus sp. TaxID=35749 RepID=UPI0026344107|nr:hypothetical protein [Thermococcus sp.]
MLAETYRSYRLAKGDKKRELAKKLVMELARHSHREPFWETVRELGLRPDHVKEVMLFLEENGEIEIRRSSDGKRLWVLTLRDIRRNPIRLDRWLALKKPQGK